MVRQVDEDVANILQGMQPPKTEENEMATKTDPAPCHTLKCPNRSICQENNTKVQAELLPASGKKK